MSDEKNKAADNQLNGNPADIDLSRTHKMECLGSLAGGVAHNFNNLLVGILGYADIALMDLPPDSPVRESVAEIESSAKRAAELTRQFLAYAGRGKLPQVETVDISRLISDMGMLLQIVASKKATLRTNLEPNLPPINADVLKLRQSLVSLIANAAEALGEKGGTISISTGAAYCDSAYLANAVLSKDNPAGLYVFVEVSDSGCGMSQDVMAKAFEPFFTTKPPQKGLGLSVLKENVQADSGAIFIESTPKRGTNIRLLYPVSQQFRADQDDAAKTWRGTGTILVVDDEETIRAIAKDMLERHGFQVITAPDGREGVDLFKRYIADIAVVVLDMSMPNMCGQDALREMRYFRADVPVILSSGYPESDALEKFPGESFAGFIQKPYKTTDLITTLRNALRHQK